MRATKFGQVLICFRRFVKPIALLLSFELLTFLPAYDKVIHSDDWFFLVNKYAFGQMRYVDWYDRRPLVSTPYRLIFDLFGMDIPVLYGFQILAVAACAILVYFIARRLFLGHEHLALLAALIFLIYPVDYTRMWLIQSYSWAIYLETLLALFLLYKYAIGGRGWTLALALVLIILPLGAYEAQLGLVAAGIVLLAIFTPQASFRRRIALLSPLLILAVFAGWRVYLQPRLLNVHDPYLGGMNLSIKTILNRLGKLSLFVTCWVQPFYQARSILTIRRLLAVLGGGMVFSALIAAGAGSEREGNPGDAVTKEDRRRSLIHLAKITGLGWILILAGLIPIIFFFTPNLHGDASRFNLYAIFGGSVALVGIIGMAAHLVAQSRNQARLLAAGAVIPLLFIGMMQQISIQNAARLAWVQQKHFWQGAFTALPNLKDGTVLVVVTPANHRQQDYFARHPLSTAWAVDGAVQTLYRNPTLRGALMGIEENIGGFRVDASGVQSDYFPPTPFERTIFLLYDPDSNQVTVVQNLQKDLALPFAPTGYNPKNNILPYSAKVEVYRALVK